MSEINHELESGDELVDTGEGTPLTVTEVHEDGGITARVWIDRRNGQEYHTQRWDAGEVCEGLVDGILEREDGKSHELVKHF